MCARKGERMTKKRKGPKKRAAKQAAHKSLPLSPETAKALEAQRQRFIEKFGRDWRPDDPIFFDPSADEPRPMVEEVLEQKMLEALHTAGIRPAIIYAFQKTGRLVTYENRKQLTKAELKEWTDAVNDWYESHGDE